MVGSEIHEVAEEELPSAEIPQNFKSFVQDAIDKHNRKSNIDSVAVRTFTHNWRDADGDVMDFTVNVGDVRVLQSVLEKKNYTLAVADVPYGFNAAGSEFDEVPFLEQDVSEMVTSFAEVTTAPMWRFVIIHSLQQTTGVIAALNKTCNAGIECGIWQKTNINTLPSRNRLAWGFETWTVGYWSQDGMRRKEMYNFERDESRVNIVDAACVTRKSLDELGCVVNPLPEAGGFGGLVCQTLQS